MSRGLRDQFSTKTYLETMKFSVTQNRINGLDDRQNCNEVNTLF